MFRIGSAEGYYGDDVTRALPMIEGGHVDVVCFEALSELTLAILRRDQMRNPSLGYTRDIEVIAERILPQAYSRKIPLITNGGGLNPAGAAEFVRTAAERQQLHGLKIATVTGDDVLAELGALLASGETFTNMETGEPLSLDGPPVVTANAYLGAYPIVQALEEGADIVVAGRVADPCLYLAPLIHFYDWSLADFDKLAGGIICGHLLECTGQVVGGNSLASLGLVDAETLAHPGYPIAEVEADGTFVITKVPGLPGRVTMETVKEQLLYEMHDPRAYITPDVVADITGLRLENAGPDRVRVSWSLRPPTHRYAQGQHRAAGGLQPRAVLYSGLAAGLAERETLTRHARRCLGRPPPYPCRLLSSRAGQPLRALARPATGSHRADGTRRLHRG